MDVVYPEINNASLVKKKAVEIPPIGKAKKDQPAGGPTSPAGSPVTPPTPGSATAPIDSTKPLPAVSPNKGVDQQTLDILKEEVSRAIEVSDLGREVQGLKDSVQDLEREERIIQIKEEMKEEFARQISSLQKELNELKEKKIPERGSFDTEGAYKEQLYPIATNVLDKIIVPMLNIVPDYNLIATQITSTFEDGTIENGIVSINMMIPNNDYRFDFRVEMPILNGLIQVPTFVTRGRKIIPLLQKNIYEELNTYSFRKLEPNYSFKKNPFSNTGENIHRKEDEQKFYETFNMEPSPVGITDNAKWRALKQRGMI